MILAELESEQTEHVHAPLSGLDGGANPAADQSKPFAGAIGGTIAAGVKEGRAGTGAGEGEGDGEEDVGACRGVSQIVHFSLAATGFCKPQSEHVHVCAVAVGAFTPAAVQLNPFMARTGAIIVNS